MQKTIEISGMSCEHCVKAVEKALKGVEGVADVRVSLEEENAVVVLGEEISDDLLQEAVDEAGYEAISIS